MGFGKKAARNIDERLMGTRRFQVLWPEFEYSMEPPEKPSERPRHVPLERPVAERAGSLVEVCLGLTAPAAAEESARCLRCDVHSNEH